MAGIRNQYVRKYGMGMITTVTDKMENTETIHYFPTLPKIDYGAVVISMNMAVASTAAGGTGFQFRLKFSHVGIKNKFR